MKLVLISDTHAQHRKLTVPDGDVLIHAGDITHHGEASTLLDFNAWLGELPHKHKIVIAGNHDMSFDPDHRDGEMEPEEAIAALSNATYLCETSTVIDGIEFYGSPITPWFCDWGFNRFRGNEIKGHWDTIPETTDVLITPTVPLGASSIKHAWE